MNINDVSKREILDFDEFKTKVHDNTYKPLSAENQTGDKERSGLHKIKREPRYDFVGYADAVFSPEKAGIEVPGYNASGDREYVNAIGGVGLKDPGMRSTIDTSESELSESIIIRFSDFE